MATSITTSYVGEVVEEILMLAVTKNQIVEKGAIHVEDNIVHKLSMPRYNASNLIQDYAVTPTGGGTLTFTERSLQPEKAMLYVEFNPDDFRKFWGFGQPKGPFVFSELDQKMQRDIMTAIIEGESGIQPYVGKAILTGDKTSGTAPYNKFNGLIKRATDDADVLDVASPVNLTSGNIISKFQAAYDLARQADKDDKNWKIYISSVDHEKYRVALEGRTDNSLSPLAPTPETWHGKELVVLTDMPEHTFFATTGFSSRMSNIWVGVSANIDLDTIMVDRVANNSKAWFMRMDFALDTQIKFGQSLVLYKQ